MKRCIALLLLLLCGCTPTARIQTPLTPGVHTPEVRLRDGYLHFADELQLAERPPVEPGISGAAETIAHADAVAGLGYDPAAVTAALPEPLRLDEASLETTITREENGAVCGGYTFRRRGDPGEHYRSETVAIYPELILRIRRGDGTLRHYGWQQFCVLPRERVDPSFDRYYETQYPVSEVRGVEVGALRFTRKTSLFPDAEISLDYAGFRVGEWAFALENWNGYCTQEEFIQVLLTILDAALAISDAAAYNNSAPAA